MKSVSKDRRLGKEKVLEFSKLKDRAEVRFVVSNYYDAQESRKREGMQLRHLGDKAMPAFLDRMEQIHKEIEDDTKKILQAYVETHPVGQWLNAQHGVGPVIGAGLLAHLDIDEAPTPGHFWSFAGLRAKADQPWEKGQVRPYNAALKQLCYHAGECFKRTSGHPDAFYAAIYQERKAFLVARNESGYNAERAKTFVVSKGATADVKQALKDGKLPKFALDRQAANYAVKIFLSHLHAVMLWCKYNPPGGKAKKKAVALPYSIEMLGHKHFVAPPYIAKMFPGLADALREAVAVAGQRKAA